MCSHATQVNKTTRAISVSLLLLIVACHNGRGGGSDDPLTAPGGGSSAPNGSDPKQVPLRGTPTATIPASPSGGVPTLGVGVGGANSGSPLQALSASVFAPVFTFVMSEDHYEFQSTSTIGTRVHSAANCWSAGVSGGVGWFSAGVRRRQATEQFLTEATRDFQGFVRLLKQRDFVSLADGHLALNQDVLNRLAAADAARQAQNWTLLAAEREAFEAVYGIGFVSEVVKGHSMHMRAYTHESVINTQAVNTFSATFSTPWISGDWSSSSSLVSAANSCSATIMVSGLGLITNPTNIPTFFQLVASFYTNLSAPAELWAGCIEYADVPAFAAVYAPMAGGSIVAANAAIAVQTLQLPVLGEVGEMVSRDSFAQTLVDTVWLSPYLFPGPYSSSGGGFVLEVRAFDLLKQLSRDDAFRSTGLMFLASRGFPVEQAAKAILMPFSQSGPGSEFPEHAGEYYRPNVALIRPRISIVQAGTGNGVDVPAVESHWEAIPTMGLNNFGGPGSNACGLFYGAGSLSFTFADTNGDILLAAQQGRLRLHTEVARGTTSIRLSQSKSVTGSFGVDLWDPSQNWIPDPAWPQTDVRVYPGSAPVVMLRWPVQADFRANMSFASAPGAWASSVTVFNWGESQDIAWSPPGYWCNAYWMYPLVTASNLVTGTTPHCGGSFVYPGANPPRGFLHPSVHGTQFGVSVYGNGLNNSSNLGSYQSLLLLGQ